MLQVCLTSLIIPQTRLLKQSLNALKEIDLKATWVLICANLFNFLLHLQYDGQLSSGCGILLQDLCTLYISFSCKIRDHNNFCRIFKTGLSIYSFWLYTWKSENVKFTETIKYQSFPTTWYGKYRLFFVFQYLTILFWTIFKDNHIHVQYKYLLQVQTGVYRLLLKS